MTSDNTRPEFYAEWNDTQLRNECARLNRVMKDVLKGMNKLSKKVEEL